jgi:O-antigen ligase
MSPLHSSIKSFLFGWGWNNYYLAWDAHYLPSINKFDPAPFDKSHNTYIDTIVMVGLFGFLAFINYLYFIFSDIKNIKHREIKISFVFLFIAVLVQYLFTFDSIIDVMMFNIFATFLIFTEIRERLTC